MNKRFIAPAVILILAIIFSTVFSLKFLINFAHDDSFYYLKIADNFAKGYGSTFDRVNITNGYHPLWFFVLSIVFYFCKIFFTFNSDSLYRVVFLFHIILCWLSAAFVLKTFKVVNPNENNKKTNISFLIFALVFVFIRDVGMESQFSCFLFSVYLYHKSKSLYENTSSLYFRLILILLLLLSRTDYIYSFIPMIIIFEIVTEKQKFNFSKILIFILSPIILTLLFRLYNLVIFGNSNIISSTIVSSFPDLSLINNLVNFLKPEIFLNQFVRSLIIILPLIIVSWYVFKKRIKLNSIEKYLLGISCGSIIFIFIHLFFNRCGIREWYLTFPLFIQGIFYSLIISRFGNLQKYYIAGSIFLFIFVFYTTRIINSKYDSIYDYAVSLREKIPNEEKIFSFDWMGVIGFFSEKKFICGDGFVNSFEYLDYINKGKFLEYIHANKVRYYSTYTNEPIDIRKSFYTDFDRMKIFNVSGLKFPTNRIILVQKYSYKHSAKKYDGYFYLVEFPGL